MSISTLSTDLDEYANRVDANVDSTNLLGRLFWYGLSEMRVPHQDFTQLLTTIGISTHQPPRQPKDADVFKRVCSSVKHDRIPTRDSDVFENYRLTEFKDDTTVTRRVVRQRVNNAGRKLDHKELFDVIFDRETGDIVFRGLNGHRFRDGTTATRIRDEIFDTYYDERGCLNTYAIREWIRGHIMGLGATMVRPGVYFLKEAHVGVIDGLEQMGEALTDYLVDPNNGTVEFHSLPLIDDRKQRDMVQRAFEAETVDAVDTLLDEISKIAGSDKKITKDRYANLLEQYQDLTARTIEYEQLLEQKLASTGTRLDIFQKSLLNIRSKVKQDT